jgi:hypothetical protein
MRDITKRFVIVYNSWPFDSFDDSNAARQRMQELIDNQTHSLNAAYPNRGWDVRPLWKVTDVTDVLAAVQRQLPLWRRFWVWCKRFFAAA